MCTCVLSVFVSDMVFSAGYIGQMLFFWACIVFVHLSATLVRLEMARVCPVFDEKVQGWLDRVIHSSFCLDIRETHLPDYQGR